MNKMEVTNTLQEHCNELATEFHRLHLEFQETPEGETIHQLRVNIKKHLAFFRLLRGLGAKLSLEECQAPFIQFSKEIGKVRNMEIRLQLIQQEETLFDISNGYSEVLHEAVAKKRKQRATSEKDISLIPFKEVSDRVSYSINHLLLEKSKENLSDYFYFLLDEIRQTIKQEVESIEQLHNIRKLLKTLFYNLKLTDRMIPKEDFSGKLYSKLEGFSEQFGNWHDEIITVEKLKDKPKKINKKVLKDLINKEAKSQQEIRNQFSSIYKLTKKIEQEIYRLFAQDKEIIPSPQQFKKEKYQKIRASFEQVNVGESWK